MKGNCTMKHRHIFENGIIKGENPPKHLLVAFGRRVFRMFHDPEFDQRKPGIYLRDLPLSMVELERQFGIGEPLEAYIAECDRVGLPRSQRVA